MQTIVGRLTANAKVNTLEDEREVVNFSVAVNDFYRPKGAEEVKQITTYFNCAYWISSKAAARLKKGTLVEVSGRIYATAYLNGNEPAARLNVQVNNFKVHAQPSAGEPAASEQPSPTEPPVEQQPVDDLPF